MIPNLSESPKFCKHFDSDLFGFGKTAENDQNLVPIDAEKIGIDKISKSQQDNMKYIFQ